jgi:hypothetical protein
VVISFWAAQQIEILETGDAVEVAVTFRPDAFEIGFLALADAKSVHGDKHISLRNNSSAGFANQRPFVLTSI